MAYYIKTPGKLISSDVYWKGNNTWTETYADRKLMDKESADIQAATTVTQTLGDKTYTYQPYWWKNCTVVDNG